MKLFAYIRKNLALLTLACSLMLVPVMSSSMPVLAATSQDEICQGFGAAGGSCSGNAASGSLNKTIASVINILSLIAGVAAVIMLIVGGFKFITSSGDANGVAGARNTIIYALVGLVVVALAQFIVHFVLAKV